MGRLEQYRLRILTTLAVSLLLHTVLLLGIAHATRVVPSPPSPTHDMLPRLLTMQLTAPPPALPRRTGVAVPVTRLAPHLATTAPAHGAGTPLPVGRAWASAAAPLPFTTTAVDTRPGVVAVAAPTVAAPGPTFVPTAPTPTTGAPRHAESFVEARAETVQATGSVISQPARLTPGMLSREPVLDDAPSPAAPATTPGVSRAAHLLTSGDPEYPPEARAEGREGTVVLNVTLDDAGRVTQVTVARGADPRLDRAAEHAVRTWTFAPALRDGHPVSATLRVNVHFHLN